MSHLIRKIELATALFLGTLMVVASAPAFAHAERQAFFPNGQTDIANPAANIRHARPEYRPLLPTPQSKRLVVCKPAGGEGVAVGKDSATLIARIATQALRQVNEQLLRECKYQHLQAAVDAVTQRGTTIYVLPGIYREEPSIRALEQNFGAATAADRDFCQAVVARGPGKLSYEEQYRCRFIQNTVAIFGDPDYTDDDCGDDTNGVCTHPQTHACDTTKSACQYYELQIEGTGEKVTDVIFEGSFINKPGDAADGHFKYLNGIRADRADGIYFRNFTTQIYEFNAVYVMETDGYVFDRLLSRWVDEYAFLSFASDHGLYDYTEGYGVADSVQYPGSGGDIYKDMNHAQANLRLRQATEVRNSKGHHSALGYSGTAGNSPWVHNNEFYKNQTGMATESVYGGHPGMPQDHALWEKNKIYANNRDYYQLVTADGPCIAKKPRDRGVVPKELGYFDELPQDYQEAIMDRTVICPPIPFPTGTGIIIAGGNYDVVNQNEVFDNWRQGMWLLAIPTLIHKLTDNPQSPLDQAGLAGPIEQNDPTGQVSTVNDALGAVTDPGNSDVVTEPIFTAHFNRVTANRFGENTLSSNSLGQPNGVDIWWDNSGTGNCFVDNTSKQGTVTTDLGVLGVTGLPTDCTDGAPDTVQQLITARPDRIAEFVDCLNYNRNNPDSKGTCPFFTAINAPQNRQSIPSKITAENPAIARKGGLAGYFVLHNNSNSSHQLQSATVKVTGDITQVGAMTLSITDLFGKTHAASATPKGDTLTFTFDTPAPIPVSHAMIAELAKTTAAMAQAPSALAPPAALLASLGVSLGGVMLLVGGVRRRDRALLVVLALAMVALSACNGDSKSADGSVAVFELTQVKFVDNPDAQYSGLPLKIGSL